MKNLLSIIFILSISVSLAQTKPSKQIDHRDDFKMNSIGGGNFRDYISSQIKEEDPWAISVRKFGSFHNHMHQWMSDLARYDADERGGEKYVPDFGNRISGGEWTEYRKRMEKAGREGAWLDLIQTIEIMHDRVHQAMLYSVIYDNKKHGRNIKISDYAGEDRMPYNVSETLISLDDIRLKPLSRSAFREFAWHEDFDNKYLHSVVQGLTVWDEMLDDMINLWAIEAKSLSEPQCRLQQDKIRYSGEDWDRYSDRLDSCPNEEWAAFAITVSIMRNRIHQSIAMLMELSKEDK